MERKEFLQLLAASGLVSAFEGCRFPMEADEPILFSMGLMTDTHVGSWFTKDASRVKQAAELFKKLGVAYIVNVGDICDKHEPKFYHMYREAMDSVFPPDKPHPTEYFVYAWHDSYAYKNHPRCDTIKDSESAFRDVRRYLRAINPPDWQTEIAGFPVLFFQQFFDRSLFERTISEAEVKYPDKPIFVFDHCPVGGTVDRSCEWGDMDKFAIVAKHPRVIHISGHIHGSLRNERNIWQGAFTAVNVGCLQVWGDKATQNYDVIKMEVREHSVTFRRFDVRDGSEIGANDPWIVPLPFDATTAPYRLEARQAKSKPVEFPVGSALALTAGENGKMGPRTIVTMPGVDGSKPVFQYRVRMTGRAPDGRDIDIFDDVVYGDFHLRPEERAGHLTTYTYPSAYLRPGERATVEATPLEFYGLEGRSIRAAVTGATRTDGGEVVYESTNPMREMKFVWCDGYEVGTKNPVAKDGYYIREGRTIGLLELPSAAVDARDKRRVRVTLEFSTRSSDGNTPCCVGVAGMDKPDWTSLAGVTRCRAGDAALKRVVREYMPKADVPRVGLYVYTSTVAKPCGLKFERVTIKRY